MIDDLEPLGALGIVDPGHLHQLLIFEARRVAQRLEHRKDVFARDGQSDLPDRVLRLDQRIAESGTRGVDHTVVGRGLRNVGCKVYRHASARSSLRGGSSAAAA